MTDLPPLSIALLLRNCTGAPHQLQAGAELDAELRQPGATYEEVLQRNRPWYRTWSTAPAPATKPPEPPVAPDPLEMLTFQIAVPYYQQLDSATDQGRRMCFSSSCAMLLQTIRPGSLKGANGDDQYLTRVRRYGDTTDAAAQIQALASYGITARFSKTGSFATLEQQLARGIPVPCGYLHRGPVSSPAGGGHWLIVVGITPTHVIVHDPLGEADLVTGATTNGSGRFCHYSRANFGRRWMVEGPETGWCILAG